MQPVNSNRIQHEVIPAQQRVAGHRETSPYTAKMPPGRGTSVLPEDVVNLSKDLSSIQDTPVTKKPSVPVTRDERKALQDSFSVYA